jgi:hypothetical protein
MYKLPIEKAIGSKESQHFRTSKNGNVFSAGKGVKKQMPQARIQLNQSKEDLSNLSETYPQEELEISDINQLANLKDGKYSISLDPNNGKINVYADEDAYNEAHVSYYGNDGIGAVFNPEINIQKPIISGKLLKKSGQKVFVPEKEYQQYVKIEKEQGYPLEQSELDAVASKLKNSSGDYKNILNKLGVKFTKLY